jgi:hypothetical protein
MKQKAPKISIGVLTSSLLIGFTVPNNAWPTTVADLSVTVSDSSTTVLDSFTTVADFFVTGLNKGKFYPATLLSWDTIDPRFQTEVPTLRSKATKKRARFKNLNTLTIRNLNNGKIYTLLSKFTPRPRLRNHEIDALKILGGDNSESLRNAFYSSDFSPLDVSVQQEFAQNLERYFSFLQDTLSDCATHDALEYYKRYTNTLVDLFSCFSSVDKKTQLAFFEAEIKKIEVDLEKTQGVRFYPLNDFFHTEMLLLYAIENAISVQDFNFETFQERHVLLVCSFNEMCPKCEGLFGKHLFRNPQRRFIVAYVNEQSSHKKRTFVAELPLGNFSKVHTPMPETKKPPKAKHCGTAPSSLLSVPRHSLMPTNKFKFFELL